jgi:nanoRNase/pAp phosphatase (c-di-AMP/oligoRNAs hydrolase)
MWAFFNLCQDHDQMDCLASIVGIMLILNGLFKSTNIVIASHYVQGGAFFQFLQLDVMHNFNKITSSHVCPVNVIELLHMQTKLPQR